MAQSDASRTSTGLLSAVFAVSLAIVLVLSGLCVCALPSSTWALSSLFSDEVTSPYSKEQLVEAALATREYTVGAHDREALGEALQGLVDGLGWSGTYRDESGTVRGLDAPEAWQLGEEYTLPDEAISHLDDVWHVMQPAYVAFGLACSVAGGCALVLVQRGARWGLGTALIVAALAVIVPFVAFGAWAAVDFNGLFTVFHSLFFAAGTWTFSYESLLICMYPIPFWIGMALIWLLTTVAGCFACLAAGRKLRKAHA